MGTAVPRRNLRARHAMFPTPRIVKILVLALFGLCCAATSSLHAQQKPKELVWTHAFDLACRKLGEDKFTKDTKKYGVEAFKDTNNDLGLFISEVGGIGITPTGFGGLTGAIADSKGPDWLTGLDLPARTAGQKAFTKDTKVHA